MKKVLIVVTAMLFVFGLFSGALAADNKCAACHKGDKAVEKIAEKKGVKTGDDLVKAVRGGSKAKIHEKLTDDDIKAALKPADKPKKKKAVEGC